jgi:hypothetical protein
MFYGDTHGWLYSFNNSFADVIHDSERTPENGEGGYWYREINLTSEVRPGYFTLD